MANKFEEEGPFGEAAPEILENRIWVDGCWDFFHHGMFVCLLISFEEAIPSLPLAAYTNMFISQQDMLARCFKHDSWAMS